MNTHPDSDHARTPTPDPSTNAITHGLTARRPLCAEEVERMEVLVASWTAKAMPETPHEEALIASAAIEYVRYLRCVDAEERRLKPGAQQALRDWRDRKQHAVRRRAQDLKHDPAAVIADLHETAFGIDWMLRHWRHLRARLASGSGWALDHLVTAMHLLGHETSPPLDRTSAPGLVWFLTAAAFPKTFQPASETPGDPAAADRLRVLVDDCITRLETLRPLVWDDIDRPEAEAIEVASLVDTSKDGQLRHRYRRDAFRDFHKSLNALTRLRSERSRNDAREQKMMQTSRAHHPERPASATLPPESRNERRSMAPSSPDDRRKPLPDLELRNEAADGSSTRDRRTDERTDERTDADRIAPDGPIGRPRATPRAPLDGPKTP